MPRLVLASGSPRRRTLLAELGLTFDVVVPDVSEDFAGSAPAEAVVSVASRKAHAAAAQTTGTSHIIGADTVGVLDGRVLGKPATADDAGRILDSLSGRTHQVVTGVAVLAARDGRVVDHRLVRSITEVTFHTLSRAAIQDYVASGEPMDKAGAYAIQGGGAAFVARLTGSYHNVVGLPVDLVLACLHVLGFELPPRLAVDPDVVAASGVPT